VASVVLIRFGSARLVFRKHPLAEDLQRIQGFIRQFDRYRSVQMLNRAGWIAG
jgi:hypothetical protein